MLQWLSETALGRLGWSEQELFTSDVNTIHVAWRGYLDGKDDDYRSMYRAAGGKYPDKEARFKPKYNPMSAVAIAKRMNERRRGGST